MLLKFCAKKTYKRELRNFGNGKLGNFLCSKGEINNVLQITDAPIFYFEICLPHVRQKNSPIAKSIRLRRMLLLKVFPFFISLWYLLCSLVLFLQPVLAS